MPGFDARRAGHHRVGARERRPRRVGHHAGDRHVPALRLLHERRALGGHRPQGVRPGQPLHRPRIQQPSLEVYPDGVMRGYHALDDDWASSFRDSGRHWLRYLRTGEGPMLWSGEEAVDVFRFALAAYASSEAGGIGVSPASLG